MIYYVLLTATKLSQKIVHCFNLVNKVHQIQDEDSPKKKIEKTKLTEIIIPSNENLLIFEKYKNKFQSERVCDISLIGIARENKENLNVPRKSNLDVLRSSNDITYNK